MKGNVSIRFIHTTTLQSNRIDDTWIQQESTETKFVEQIKHPYCEVQEKLYQ